MSDATWTALTTLSNRTDAETLAERLEHIDGEQPTGIGVFEIEDGSGRWEVGAYFSEKPDDVALMLLGMSAGAAPFAVSKVEPEDWVAKVRRELTPVRAGRFVLHGAHDEGEAPPSAIRLRIEAAMAFGTGHHGTTRGCMLAMDGLAKTGFRPARVLDLGTGTGALGMGAARLWKSRVLATDIDGVAVATAQENARWNRTGTTMRTIRAARATGPEVMADAPYDLIFANILAAPLRRLAPQIGAVLAPGGHAVLSGLLHKQAIHVERVFNGHRMIATRRIRLDAWTTLVLRRY